MSTVLVIYTGGTIGMKPTPSGYEPARGYLSDVLCRSTTFNDTSRPIKKVSAIRHTGAVVLDAFSLPPSVYGDTITYAILEYETLLDSSSIKFTDWIKIARTVERNYRLYDGFVILHGTDSMAYSSSMLSFLLQDLGKTVIFTGSQIPISRLRNDAQENLLSALLLAGHYVIPEVSLFFHHELFRGNRVTKVNATGFDAFASPNCLPLATVGVDIIVHWQRIHRPTRNVAFKVPSIAEVDVASLYIFPGIKGGTIRALAKQPGLRGIVLHTFGSGNVPADDDLISALHEAANERGIVLVNITQCLVGSVAPIYAAGAVLSSLGVVSGFDMTAECALTKLAYLLGLCSSPSASPSSSPARTDAADSFSCLRPSQSRKMEVARLCGQNLRGELTTPESKKAFDHGDAVGADDAGLPSRTARHRLSDLLWAIAADDLGAVSGSLDDETVNAYSAEGTTPLLLAARLGRERVVRTLLASGAFVFSKDKRDGHTALYVAQEGGFEGIIRMLRDCGAHLNATEKE